MHFLGAPTLWLTFFAYSSCELKLSRRSESFVAIVRDVTERVKRFEAEQRATAEALARQKDAQNINRFTRHEIKNGLLAGIELCDRLRRSFQSASNKVDQRISSNLDSDDYKKIESDMTKTDGMIGQVLKQTYTPSEWDAYISSQD